MGDSYASGGTMGASNKSGLHDGNGVKPTEKIKQGKSIQRKPPDNLKPKDLLGIPWRLAFALQAAGWWLRQDIIWAKPNPMPESVTDRCTKAHEYIFMLTKSARYWYDAGAIMEPAKYGEEHANKATSFGPNGKMELNGIGKNNRAQYAFKGENSTCHKSDDGEFKRNKRSVWTVATSPYPDAHFATYPQDLIRPCILAGCPPGGTVLDPFLGSGTTALVAREHGRKCIGIELNPEYCKLALNRLRQTHLVLEFA